MKLTAIIVNDEPPVIENYRRIIEDYCPSLQPAANACSLAEAGIQAEKYRPAIIFWDIDNSATDPLHIINTKWPEPVQHVFIIAYNEALLSRIKSSPVEYILKPVHPAEMMAVESKMLKQLSSTSEHGIKYYQKLQKAFQQSFKVREKTDAIAVYVNGHYQMVSYSDITAFEASGAYTKIHMDQHKTFISSKNIGYYQELIGEPAFCRVHKSFIVNIGKIASVDKAMRMIRMLNNQLFPVSVRLMSGFMSQIAK